MARKNVTIRTAVYRGFRGVDFSSDASLVENRRSPLAINMVADEGGMPEKRLGWRVVEQFEGGRINNIWSGKWNGEIQMLAHVGDKIFRWHEDGETIVLADNLADKKGTAVYLNGKLWILTGGEYLVYDGAEIKPVRDIAYAPITVVGRSPAGGGKSFENINLCGRYRRNEFIPDGQAREYQLDTTELDPEGEVTATVWGEDMTEGSGFTVNRQSGVVTFDKAPQAAEVGAEGAVIIRFPKTIDGYEDTINSCTIATTYGVGGNDRIFFAGNPNPGKINLDWHSALNDPSYVPDLSYSVVGNDSTAIMGYLRIGSAMAVIKEDNGQDSTVFLRYGNLSDDGEAVFSLKQSIAGVGAVSKGAFSTLGDDPLFLSDKGVYAITTNALTSEKIVQNRSFYVNARLTKEDGIANAVCEQWRGLFILCVNSKAYVMDGRQRKTYRSESMSDYVYECYYWENIPAVSIYCNKSSGIDELYFGTEDGRICKFNSDIDGLSRFSDGGRKIGNMVEYGSAIDSLWATKMDDDGDPMLLKTMLKKGNAVTLKPYSRSSCQICFVTDKITENWDMESIANGKLNIYSWLPENIVSGLMDIFDWEDIDFERFTFNANDSPAEIAFNRKIKKYKRLQFIVRNNVVNEGFGVYGIVKHYVVGNYSKE